MQMNSSNRKTTTKSDTNTSSLEACFLPPQVSDRNQTQKEKKEEEIQLSNLTFEIFDNTFISKE